MIYAISKEELTQENREATLVHFRLERMGLRRPWRGARRTRVHLWSQVLCVPKPRVKFIRAGRHTAHRCQFFCSCWPLFPKPDSHWGKDNCYLTFIQQLQRRYFPTLVSLMSIRIFLLLNTTPWILLGVQGLGRHYPKTFIDWKV